MKVLIACEYSGIVRDSFINQGHDAISCDLLPTDKPGPHYQGDVFDIINDGFDLMIAHPPCTYLSNAGARFLYPQKTLDINRYKKGLEAKDFFLKLLNSDIQKICVENPISSKIYELPKHTQTIQPWQFGHPYSKTTRLWLKNLPPLIFTNILKDYRPLIRSNVTAKKRKNQEQRGIYSGGLITAKTFQGIADAMAEQWGSIK